MCLAQGHNAVTTVRLEPAALRSQVKHSTMSHCAPQVDFGKNSCPEKGEWQKESYM